MNTNKFVTHFRGIPLKSLDREEVIEALQYYYKMYQEGRHQRSEAVNRSGRGLVETYEGRSPFTD